jgi:hypothetical protein
MRMGISPPTTRTRLANALPWGQSQWGAVQLGLASWAVPLPPRLATTWRPQRQCGAGLLVLYPVATPMAMMPMVTMMAAAVPVALAATMKHAVHMHSEPTPPGGSSAWPSKQTFVEPPHEERAFKITSNHVSLQKYRGRAGAAYTCTVPYCVHAWRITHVPRTVPAYRLYRRLESFTFRYVDT